MPNYMICVDGSDHARNAFFTGESFLNKDKDHLYILSVADDVSVNFSSYWGFGQVPIAPVQEAQDKIRESVRENLHRYGAIAHGLGIKYTLLLGTASHVGELICQAAEKKNIDFLVIGRRGMSPIKRFFVGSTSKYIVEHASCNVYVIKSYDAIERELHHQMPASLDEEEDKKRKVRELEVMEHIHLTDHDIERPRHH
eukprot:TRINITY_DN1619_c0_g1_i1.p1 TRINITY_DN1619_c0_g1~~TRINITY_DN1619_c0_g1_i1.p1  ORF type:complete len:198 (-),score=58.33 TRINITY_DN1619_c0_g1_i1:64-657(-)